MKCQLGHRTVVDVEANQAGSTETAPVYKMEIPAVVLDWTVQRMPLTALGKIGSRRKGYLHTACAMLDDDIDGCAGEVQRSDEAKRVSGLFQALLGCVYQIDPYQRGTLLYLRYWNQYTYAD